MYSSPCLPALFLVRVLNRSVNLSTHGCSHHHSLNLSTRNLMLFHLLYWQPGGTWFRSEISTVPIWLVLAASVNMRRIHCQVSSHTRLRQVCVLIFSLHLGEFFQFLASYLEYSNAKYMVVSKNNNYFLPTTVHCHRQSVFYRVIREHARWTLILPSADSWEGDESPADI